MQQEWYIDWFNSKYYSMLYKHRDVLEAKAFIKKIVEFLESKFFKKKIQEQVFKALDVGCGDGRHSVVLNQLGFDVLGVDISESKIKEAQKYENEKLRFFIGDMRKLFFENEFDLVLNLFTSFGYFENLYDNMIALLNMRQAMKGEGILIIDYLNADYVVDHLIPYQELHIEGVTFIITRRISQGFVKKVIQIQDNGQKFEFYENVQLFTLQDFTSMLHQSRLKIVEIWGNYLGELFTAPESERLILFCTASE
ncbi:MAG: class I SAM-dependent methyltransferase [Bacteroidia bacterium]|nr:class I SAM-dependent methyltransferase [Bacteroidia bacterium]MDW8158818.1 class I SAM-dependent methyltransferase [Bacteroidia bacterium]